MDAMQYGFYVGQRLASHNVKTAVNLGGLVTGINKGVRGLMGAADTASTAKPAVAAATSRVPPPLPTAPKVTVSPAEAAAGRAAIKITPQDVAGGGVKGPDVIPWGKDHSQAMANYTARQTQANPHAHQFGQPLKVAPPAGAAPAVRPAAPPLPPPAPTAGKVTVSPAEAAAGRSKVTITPQEAAAAPTNAQGAQMFFDNAQSGGRQQMLGYGQRGAPSNLPQKWDQLSPEQQATVAKTLGY